MSCTLCWAVFSEEGWTACRAAQCLSGESLWREWGAKGAGQAGGSEESLLEYRTPLVCLRTGQQWAPHEPPRPGPARVQRVASL